MPWHIDLELKVQSIFFLVIRLLLSRTSSSLLTIPAGNLFKFLIYDPLRSIRITRLWISKETTDLLILGLLMSALIVLDYLAHKEYEWDRAFVGWAAASQEWKESRQPSQNYWSPFNLMKDRGKRGSLPDLYCYDLEVHWHVNWLDILLFSRLMIGSFVMEEFFIIMVTCGAKSPFFN